MTKKEFGCEKCGHTITGMPPDDIHTIFSILKSRDDCIETIYNCENCHQDTKRYWCTPSPRFVVGRSFDELD